MNTTLTIIATLTILITTNEVKIGTAIIGNNPYDVVKLQVVTNSIVTSKAVTNYLLIPPTKLANPRQESWTNTYEGPIVGTNLTPSKSLGILWDYGMTNFITTNYWLFH